MRYENLAKKQLEASGLKFLRGNYHSRFGELDLIMRDGDTLCFIEVKYRSSNSFGGAAYAISAAKQKKLVKTALSFISVNPRLNSMAARFDALLLQQEQDGSLSFNWIKNAFYAE